MEDDMWEEALTFMRNSVWKAVLLAGPPFTGMKNILSCVLHPQLSW